MSSSLIFLLAYFLRQGLSLKAELTERLKELTSNPPGFSSPALGKQAHLPYPAFSIGTGDPNSGPHICVLITLATEPPPQPQCF